MCSWTARGLSVVAKIVRQAWLHLTDPSLVPIDDHDDVVIYLRLGDGLGSKYGDIQQKSIFPHKTYSSLIEQAQRIKGLVRTIGIVNAPFEGKNVHSYDKGRLLGKNITLDLMDSIEKDFPHAKARLHNSPEQTIIGSYCPCTHGSRLWCHQFLPNSQKDLTCFFTAALVLSSLCLALPCLALPFFDFTSRNAVGTRTAATITWCQS